MPNSNGQTPWELFTEKHRELVKEGQTWMKETATSCTVVAALIVTIMFATAFTVPGGNSESGFPLFSAKKLFNLFIVCDALSFLSSSISIFFLGILTSRYGEEYFLKSLPTKMIIGLTSLFISISTMTIAFFTALLLMQHVQSSEAFIPVVLLSSVPITLFVKLQFPLLFEIFISTYGPSIFNRTQDRIGTK
ncbi:hypothetical protein L1049_027324 [Liquidambar formosana]|uniref:PGG domain-containing protein n=1 Tax=Liquidambar formosana TaxID=63359 RepID=A0AAP0R1U5_LIQFO